MHLARLTAFLSALAVFGLPAPTRAETVNCTPINAVPAVITLPGVYCLTKSLVTSISTGNAIDIQANNVILDMNGHRLGGLAAGLGTTAYGVYASNRQNITIRNGTIRGFYDGISMGGGSGHLVEDIRADQNTHIGIAVVGAGSIVRNNQVVATGGSTIFGPTASAFGIAVSGAGVRALNNDVITVVHAGSGLSYGIGVGPGSDGSVAHNRITNASNGVFYSVAGATGKYRDNLTSNVTTPYTGGTDAGNNN